MALQSFMVPLGTSAPDFDLPVVTDQGTTGERRLALADVAEPVLVVAFLCNHCPYVQHVEKQLGALTDEYGPRGVAAVGICANDADTYPDDSPSHLAEQRVRAGWTFPYLVDEAQDVARAYQAACTPDFFVYGARDDIGTRRLVYRGAMDDSTPRNGRANDGRHLRYALDLALQGKRVPEPHVPSMGCSIKWRGEG